MSNEYLGQVVVAVAAGEALVADGDAAQAAAVAVGTAGQRPGRNARVPLLLQLLQGCRSITVSFCGTAWADRVLRLLLRLHV
jgi:hypothetical protein